MTYLAARTALLLLAAACIAAQAAAQFVVIPNLSEDGGPPFLDSVVYGYASPADAAVSENGDAADGGIVRNGVHAGGRFTYTRYYPNSPLTFMGQYLSWECLDPQNQPGAYRAVVAVTNVIADPANARLTSSVPIYYCEYGVVSPAENTHAWAWGRIEVNGSNLELVCPQAPQRIDYRDWSSPNNSYVCGEPEEVAAVATADTGDQTLPDDQPAAAADWDGDGAANIFDQDNDGDGVGDATDPDDNGDGVPDSQPAAPAQTPAPAPAPGSGRRLKAD